MDITLPLLLGFGLSALGILLPGLINMTAAKISIRDGHQRAVVFALGAASVIFIQTYVAVSFAKFISSHPDIIELLEEVGLVIFLLLTVYFLFLVKKKIPKVEDEVVKLRSKTGNFFLGALLSSLNFFPIPYYVFVSVTLAKQGYFEFGNLFVLLFVTGATLGALAVFYLYIICFKKVGRGTIYFMENSHYFIGAVTGLVSILALIRILRNL
ncbi:lysine transporter LysE [Flavobacterium cyanobacteriorum]|uniref:Lysine transporter LysE n=1 Tax=Flavobacterium cyanobacteriorum TaxID=2022802 RepID=A0A255ZB78_9FLAO|nr:lysine transporter LysE [Flavobacterium cyanobacteriorum]OYQ37860.1 lysine transporter LysE [Flavobacterium cyanobacteriorum]